MLKFGEKRVAKENFYAAKKNYKTYKTISFDNAQNE